jgi:outer membrane receptor for ferrienterochelin and colicin
MAGAAVAQPPPDPARDGDSNVRYPADFFAEYGPVSANDMLSRIPGINLALESNEQRRGNQVDRGLGDSSQILINGKRMAGKANEARAQLDRITAAQVDYIEIVRGTSGSLDVRNTSGQLVNIVLRESFSTTSLATEMGLVRFHDGQVEPTGNLSVSGQRGLLQYLLSLDLKSGYEFLTYDEDSIHPDGRPNEKRTYEQVTEADNITLSSNLVWDLTPNDRLAINVLLNDADPPRDLRRTITDFNGPQPLTSYEHETYDAGSDSWEIGGDYEHQFLDSGRFKALLIANEKSADTLRERFVYVNPGDPEVKNLYLFNDSVYAERILRSSYTFDLNDSQALELGLEAAKTTQDSVLRQGVLRPGTASELHGGLVAVSVPNAISTVEETRYEGFAVHNWVISPRMTLESSLLYEVSEISQQADVDTVRDFDFIKPKVDWRFNLSRTLQLRASIERQVAQLSFADFSANTNNRDLEQDIFAGNPDLEQETSWRYTVNMDYRLPDDGGVVNSRVFWYDIQNVIDRVDVSPSPTRLQSANGNVGDGTVIGFGVDTSLRLNRWGLPQAVLTAGVLVQDSYIFDPMSNLERKVVPYDRGNYRIGFRQDVPAWNFNYGLNFRDGFEGNRPFYDIDSVTFIRNNQQLSLFAEKVAWGGFTYRAELNNALDWQSCRERTRYAGYLRDGVRREVEHFCTQNGEQFVLRMRGTF